MAFVSYENLQLYTTKMKDYVGDSVVTYTFTEDTEKHTLTIVGTDGTNKTIALGEDITADKVIAALGFTPANETDIPSALSELTDDATHRVVTDTEKASWNAKSEFSGSYNDLEDKPSIPSIEGLATEAQVNAKYTKPSDGIPKTDLSSSVQTSLEKADSALQSFTETDPTVPAHVKAITEQNISNWNSKAEAGDIPNVPAWALESEKPSYTATEVGADTVGAATSALANANSYTDKKIADLINGAPETLDTLKEIADAMAEDKKVVEALNTAIGTKVDKVEGKGLSTNDFTATYKSAIDNLPSSYAPTNAERNVVVGVQVNGTDVTVDSNRKVNITVPTSASDIGAQAALSAAQLNAANSGITSTKVSTYDGYASSISAKYTKPSTGIPASDLASGVIPTSLPASNVTDTYSSTGTAPVSGKAVASAISGKANSSDLPGTETTNIDFDTEW